MPCVHASGHLQAQRRGLEQTPSSQLVEGPIPTNSLMSEFSPPELWDKTVSWLRPPRAWDFVTAALRVHRGPHPTQLSIPLLGSSLAFEG